MRSKRLFTMLLAIVMVLSVLSPAAYAVAPVENSVMNPGETAEVVEATESKSSSITNELLVSGADTQANGPYTLRDEDKLLNDVKEVETTQGEGTWTATQVDANVDLTLTDLPECLEELQEAAAVFEARERVVAFVVMEQAPLCETVSTMSMVDKASEADLLAVQDKVIDEIEADVLGGEELEVRYQFTYLTNSFSIETEFENLEQIALMENVKSVFVMPVFEAVAAESASPNTFSAGEMTGVDQVWEELGYTGAGMKIAIIDTGLDLDHPSFAADPAEADSSMTKADIEAVLDDLNASSIYAGLTADDLYRSAKVPYAFNYVDANLTADHSADKQGDHGTHVAGIAAANATEGTTVVGMAPDAQLIIMKVFGASGGAYMDDIAAALEDAMTLGCDVVNASLGSPAGFSSSDSELDLIYDRLASQDIVVTFSAGNEGVSSDDNMWGTEQNNTSNPDNATVGSPSTYANVMSIASADNAEVYANYMNLADGTEVVYNGSYEWYYGYVEGIETLVGKELEYYVIDGFGGELSEFYDEEGNSLVSGKVAVVQRGGQVNFGVKVQNAADAGAVACLIWNNESGSVLDFYISITLTDDDGNEYYPSIPAALISQEDGQTMKEAEVKTLVVAADETITENATAGQISSFSSWGVSPDLRLVPDVTGVGGSVYSCYDGGTYGYMSGTSMSSPQVAGVSALVMQYLYTVYPNAPDGSLREVAEALLMSTADPIIDSVSGVEASPRQQGAGLVDAYEAVTSKAYLTVGGNRPKAELGDSTTGKWVFTFEIHNFSDKAKTYELDGTILTEDTDEYDAYPGEYFMAGHDVELDGSVTFDKDSVTVAAGKTAKVKVTVELSAEDKAMFAEKWENGGYVEGYVYLTSADEEGVVEQLNLPYLGFYGDWTDAPIFDTAYWYSNSMWGIDSIDGDEYWHIFWTDLAGSDWVLGFNPYAGAYTDAEGNVVYNPANNVVSPNGDGAIDGIEEIYLSLLRNAKTLTFTYTVNGEVVHQETSTNNSKTMYISSYGQVVPWLYSWYGEGMYDFTDAEGNVLADGTEVILTIDATLDYSTGGEDTMTVPMYVDCNAPELVNIYEIEQNGSYYLVVEAKDATDLAAAFLMNPSGSRIYGRAYDVQMDQTQEGTWLAYFDVTGLGTKFMVALCDYGANEGYYEVTYECEGDNLPDMTDYKDDLFAYRVYDSNIYSDHMYGWVSMGKPASAEDVASIGVWTDDYMEYAAINAAEYVDGKIFAVDAVYNLVVMDPGLFDRQTICNLGVNVIDMTFDDSTETMYVLSKQSNYMYLYSMDLLTGELTQLKNYGYYTRGTSPWNIADDDNGTIYAIKYNSNVLYKLDSSYALTEVKHEVDGVETSVTMTDSTGAAAKPSAYAQSMTYSDGKLYWAYYRSRSDLIVIDTETWNTFAVPYEAYGYNSNNELVAYAPTTELVGLLTLEETNYQIPESTALKSVTLSADSLLMKVGDSQSVSLTTLPWNYEVKNVEWTSGNESVATVVDGVVTGVGEGTTTITVNADGIEASLTVTVVLVEGHFNAYNYYSYDGYYGYLIDVDMETMDYTLTGKPPVDFISGDYNGHDGCFYGYTENGQFYRWNLETDELTAIGAPYTFAVDMAYDYSTGLMYALYTDTTSTYESKLCVVNMNTGAVKELLDFSGTYGVYAVMTLACDSKMDEAQNSVSTLYAMDYAGQMYTIDTESYMPAYSLGGLGDNNYVQSMCWDYANDVLLWANCDGVSVNWINVKDGYMLQLGDPTESGVFEFVGMYTDYGTVMELPYQAVTSVEKNDMLVLVGGSKPVDVTVYPFNATNQNLELTSANENVAIVKDGMVVGVSQGKTTVSYKLDDNGTVYEGSIEVTVLQGADNVYGHIMSDLAYGSVQNWAQIYPEDTNNLNYLAYMSYTIFAEEYVDGKLYAYGYDAEDWTANWQYFVIDAATFETLSMTDMGESFPYVYDMTYDYATGTMFAVAGASEDDMNLYMIDMETGKIHLLMQTEQNFMSIASAEDGMLYAIENSVQDVIGYDDWGWEIYGYTNAKLYSINAKTLEISYVGDTGMQCDKIASMAYDHDTKAMYWTPLSYNGNGISGLAIVNLETGAATNLGAIGASGSQVAGLYIVADEFPAVDTSALYNVIVAPSKTSLNIGESFTVTLNTIPMNLDGAEVVWSSSNKRVATVDENGTVTAQMQGKAEITASVTYNGKTLTGSCTVSSLAEDAAFLTWNRTDMGWTEISRANYADATNLTVGEEVGVSAIAVKGVDVYGYDDNGVLFQLNTEDYSRTTIGESINAAVINDYREYVGVDAEDYPNDMFKVEIRDMEYDAANSRMLLLTGVLLYEEDSGSYDEVNNGCAVYSVNLTDGAISKLYTFADFTYIYSLAANNDGVVYFFTTFDDGIYKLDVDNGTFSKLISLQTQSLYGEYGEGMRHAMYYDDLTGNLYMTFTSNGKYYRMLVIDSATGALTAVYDDGSQMFIGEMVEDGYAYTTDLYSGLVFVNEYFHVCDFGEWTTTKEATCTEPGERTRECECGEVEVEVIEAIGHSYTSEFVWAEDYSSCDLVYTCGNCGDTYAVECTVTSETTDATCEEDGLTVYTATVVVEDETITDTVEVVIEATGHDYNFFGKCTVCGAKKTSSWWDKIFGGWGDDDDETTEPTTPETSEPETSEPETSEPETSEPDDGDDDNSGNWWSGFFGWFWPFG